MFLLEDTPRALGEIRFQAIILPVFGKGVQPSWSRLRKSNPCRLLSSLKGHCSGSMLVFQGVDRVFLKEP